MPTKQESLKHIAKQIAVFKAEVELHGRLGWTDIHKHAERLFCAPLALVLGGDVTVLEHQQKDFPAIDLYCKKAKTGIQVTSTNTHEKIQHTLDETRRHLSSSVVERVIVLIIGDKKNYRATFTPPDWLPFSLDEDIWDMRDLVLQIENACDEEDLYRLSADLDYQNKDRTAMTVEEIKTYILQLEEDFKYLSSRLRQDGLHNSLPIIPAPFLHEKLLAQLKERTKQAGPVFLIGPPGTGRKTLAAQMGHEYYDGIAHYVAFRNNFKDTISQELSRGILSACDLSRLTPEELFNQTLQRLQENDLLIIHDAALREDFETTDAEFVKLCGMPIKLIITTSHDVSAIFPNTLRMTPPDEPEKLLRLMPDREEAAYLPELIAEAGNHPGMVRILAEYMRDNYEISPARLLEVLRSNILYDDMSALYQKFREAAPVAGLKDAEQDILRLLVLVREDMTEPLFRRGLVGAQRPMLNYLLRTGWLCVDTQNRLRFSSPVIRFVSRMELPFDYEKSRPFLMRLYVHAAQACPCHGDCAQIADCLDRIMADTAPHTPLDLQQLAAKIARLAGRNEQAVRYENPILAQERSAQDDRSYQELFYLALECDRKGKLQNALNLMHSAITIATIRNPIKELPPAPDVDLYLLYQNYAVLCQKAENLDKAEEYYREALRCVVDGYQKAETCILMSQLYRKRGKPGDDRAAMQYAREAIECAGSDVATRERALLYSARVHFEYQKIGKAYEDAGEALRTIQAHHPADSESLRQARFLATQICQMLAVRFANASCGDATVFTGTFEQAQHYAQEALDHAKMLPDNDSMERAYYARMYVHQQAARGACTFLSPTQAQEYIQLAVDAYRTTPAACRSNLTPMMVNLAKIYQTLLTELTDRDEAESPMQPWLRVWEFCAEFECLHSYTRDTLYPQIIANAELREKKLTAEMRSNLQILPQFYKQMIEFFTDINDSRMRAHYFKKLQNFEILISATLS